jgi:hypothetical protein
VRGRLHVLNGVLQATDGPGDPGVLTALGLHVLLGGGSRNSTTDDNESE